MFANMDYQRYTLILGSYTRYETETNNLSDCSNQRCWRVVAI